MAGQHDQTAAHVASLRTLGSPVSIKAGTVLFRPGDACQGLLLVTAGAVRVQLVTESGRQLTLYRVRPDFACVLSTQCLMTGGAYPAEGVAETDVSGRFLRPGELEAVMRDDPDFRSWLFSAYGSRLIDLVLLVDELMANRIESRLAQFLMHRANADSIVRATHQAIATELGTAREVVSRHLKELERRGALALRRGEVELLRRDLLVRLAGVGAN